MSSSVPIITIDGPAGSGKGSVCKLIAAKLGWNLLDSGALYRLTALQAMKSGVALDDAKQLSQIATNMKIRFHGGCDSELEIFLDEENVTKQIRTEQSGVGASKVSQYQEVRAALLQLQRDFARKPGLIADGRDMGTVVFPNAQIKVFLTASREERAKRRDKQLNPNGNSGNLAALLRDIDDRDRRDSARNVAPMRAAEGAIVIDSTAMSIDQVVEMILSKVNELGLFPF